MIQAVFFDVANTLLEKPGLYKSIQKALVKNGYELSLQLIAERHKLLSEIVEFPDKTSADFYKEFNSKLLLLLGIIPAPDLLEEIFTYCSYLPWQPFSDTKVLDTVMHPVGVVSNWDRTLPQKLEMYFDKRFEWVLCSEEMNFRKPDIHFYKNVLTVTGYKAEEILYIGDSIKLDMAPAAKLGFRVLLIDRSGLYPAYAGNRITDLEEIKYHL